MRVQRDAVQRDRDMVDIAAKYLSGRTLREITSWLNANRPYQSTVGVVTHDLERARIIWRERAATLVGERKVEELARLDRIEREAWDCFERSKSDKTRKYGERRAPGEGKPSEVVGQETEQRDGNPKFLEVILRCVEQRLDVLGLKSPRRLQVSGPGGGPIQTEAVDEYDHLDDATILELNRVLREAGRADAEHASAPARNN